MLVLCIQAWLAASIEGRLWNPVTGAPVRKADVMVGTVDGRPVKRAISDVNGRYLVEGLAAGRYRVAAGRAGYLPALSNVVVALKEDEARRDVNIAMELPAVISGHVFDGEGEPVDRVKVTALEQDLATVRRAGEAVTNDRGEYRIAGLAAGSYVLRTAAADAREEQIYAPVYYPAAEEWAGAATVRVGRGGEAQGIDFRVDRVAPGMVTGAVKAEAGVSGQLVMLRVARRGRDAVMAALPERELQALPGDKFVIPKLAPGAYVIEALAEGAAGALYWAVQEAVVGAGSNSDVEVPLVKGLELTAQVSPEQPVRLSLTRVSGVTQAADGKLRFRNLTPGTWKLEVSGLPANSYVEKIRWGDREAAGGVLEIAGGGALKPLRIEVSDAGGAVQGAAKDEGTPVSLEADDGSVARRAMAGGDGAFRLNGIRPGKYRLRCGEAAGKVFEVGARGVVKRDCRP